MSDRDPASYTAADLADPTIAPATLGQIASVRPDLWPAILAHPNCYPELAAFIQQHSAPESGDQSGVSEAAQQISDGAKQVAAGAKDYFNQTLAPAAANANKTFQNALNSYGGTTPQASLPKIWPLIGVAISAFVSVISIFLPAVVVRSYSYRISVAVIDDNLGSVFLIAFLATFGFAVVLFVTRKKWARLAAAYTGSVTGFIVFVKCLSTVFDIGHGASVGIGLILLLFTAAATAAFAGLLLLPKWAAEIDR